MKGLMLVGLNLVALGAGIGGGRSERALRRAWWRFPIESVLLAGIADELLRVLLHAIVLLREVFMLRVDHCRAGSDGCDFVSPDAPGKYLVPSGIDVEVPLARGVLLKRN